MTSRTSSLAAALAVLAAAPLAACSSGAPSSAGAPASPAAAARATASAAPKAPAGGAGTVSALAACKSLAAWENGSSSGSVADDATLRQTFKDTTQPLSGDFATWTAGIKSGGADDTANADRVGSDCAAWDVTVFTPVPAEPSPATASQAPAPETVTFEVSGSYAQVTYGPAGSNTSGTVPMKVTQKLGNPIYYAITAQLQGGGAVSCKIEVDGKVISKATASGGFNIASCEISRDPINGGWEDTNVG